MEIHHHSLRRTRVGSSQVADIRLSKKICPVANLRHLKGALAIHVKPATLLAGASNGGNCHFEATHRMRLEGGPYMAMLPFEVAGKQHISIFNPGSKKFAYWVRQTNARGYIRAYIHDLMGRFFIVRADIPQRNFFESALEVHEASSGVSAADFLQAVGLFESCLNVGGFQESDWLPAVRSNVLAVSVVDAGDGRGC